MNDYKVDRNNDILKNAVKSLRLRFPIADISKKTNYEKGSISNFLSDKKAVSDNFLQKFAEAYNLNLDDFREDEGVSSVVSGPTIEDNKHEDKVSFYYPYVNASAGLDVALENKEVEKIPVSIPNFGSDISFINVFGDSMYPKFCSGEIIGIKEIDAPFVNYGYAYVVVFENGEVYLKYIRKGRDDDHWTLASENGKYEAKEYHLSLIRRVYIVKGVITKTTM